MSAERRACVRDFWQLPPRPRSDWKAKYESLLQLGALSDTPQRRDLLREIARDWPGALREAELVSPSVLEGRARDCASCADTSLVRAQIGVQGGSGWLLACELNDRLRVYARMRQQSRAQGEIWSFADAYASLNADDAALWPRPGDCPGLDSHPPSSRLAYLALAWACGLSLPRLNRIILDRAGHWDRREDDPPWAHQRGPAEADPSLGLGELR